MSGARRARVDAPLPPVGGEVVLSPEDSRHLCGVLRLREGDAIELFDGSGWLAPAALVRADKRGATARVTAAPVDRTPPHRRHLALAILKGATMDEAIRMATEAGMTDLHPVLAARSVATGDRTDRWVRIVESAAAQCLRADVPQVHSPAALGQVLDQLSPVPCRLIAHPGEGVPTQTRGQDAAVLVGPEGGWTEAELRQAHQAGWQAMRLGPWVLRARTAAPMAMARLCMDDDTPC